MSKIKWAMNDKGCVVATGLISNNQFLFTAFIEPVLSDLLEWKTTIDIRELGTCYFNKTFDEVLLSLEDSRKQVEEWAHAWDVGKDQYIDPKTGILLETAQKMYNVRQILNVN